jgi:hypothetical protein
MIMGVVTIDEKTFEVPDEVAKFIDGLIGDYQSALASARAAEGRVTAAEQATAAAIANGEAKIRAEGARIIGWVEARAHSFFLQADGDFHQVVGFLRHVAQGLESHLQPMTLSGSAPSAVTPAVKVSVASGPAPAPAAPASPAAQPAAPSTPAPGAQP